jgi:hypothetical protein
MLAILTSASLQGIDAELVHVEVNTGEAGAPTWSWWAFRTRE